MHKQTATKSNLDMQIVVIGPSKCGKTSLLTKYTKNTFTETYKKSSIQENYFKTVTLNYQSKKVHFIEFNSEYVQVYKENISLYKVTAALIVVCDASNPDSLNAALEINNKFNVELPGSKKKLCILLETKSDLVPKKTKEEEKKFKEIAIQNGFLDGFSVSAKNGNNIQKAIELLLTKRLETPIAPIMNYCK